MRIVQMTEYRMAVPGEVLAMCSLRRRGVARTESHRAVLDVVLLGWWLIE